MGVVGEGLAGWLRLRPDRLYSSTWRLNRVVFLDITLTRIWTALLDSVPPPPRGRLPHAARPASCPGHRARSLGHYTTKPLLIPSSPLRRGPYTIYRHIVLQRPSPNAMPPNNLPTPTPRRSRPSRSSRRPSNPDTHADWVLYPAGSPREGVQPGSMSSYANTITNARPPDMPLVR